MGNTLDNTPIKIKNAYNPSLNGWQIIQKKDFHNVWKNSATQQQMQQYFYNANDSNEYKKIKELFAFRFEREFLVNSKYFKQMPSKQMCSTHYGASIFTQRIIKRLSSFNKIKFPSILHVYHASLRGFNELYQKIGYFPVSQQMIGLDTLKRIKVWVSPNFGSQAPEFGSRYKTQKDLIKQIVNLIASYTENQIQREQIDLYLDKGTNFQSTLHLLYDYASQYSAQIPSYIDDTNIDNQLDMLQGISQNLEVFSKQKQNILLEKSSHSNQLQEKILAKPTKQKEKSIGSDSYKLNNLPIKYGNSNKIEQGRKNMQSQYFDKKFMNKQQKSPNKFINPIENKQQRRQQSLASPGSNNIIYKPQNQIIKHQINKLKYNNNPSNNNNNNFRISSISEVPNSYDQRVYSFNPQRAGIKESPSQIVIIKNPGQLNMHLNNQNQFSFSNKSQMYQPRKSAIIIRNESNQLSRSRLIENRMKAAQMKNQQLSYSRLLEQNKIMTKNQSNLRTQQNQLSRSRLIQNRMKAKQISQQSTDINLNKQKNTYQQSQNQRMKSNPHYQPKALYNQGNKPEYQQRRGQEQVVSRIQRRHVLLDQQQKNMMNKPQMNANYYQKPNNNYGVTKQLQRQSNNQQFKVLKNQRELNVKPTKQIGRSKQQNNYNLATDNKYQNQNSVRQERKKNVIAQKTKVSKKREYTYQFDIPADESSSDDESQHIKIIINSQAKNKNKNLKVQKIKS